MATPKVVDFFDTNAAAANLNVPVRKFRSWANGQLNKAEKEAGLSLVGFPKPVGKSGKHHWSNRALSKWTKVNNAALVTLGYHVKVAEKKTVQTIGTAELTREYGISATRLNMLAKATGVTREEAGAGMSLGGFPKPIKVGAANLWPKVAIRKWFKANKDALEHLGYIPSFNKKAAKPANAAKAIKPKALKQPVVKASKKVETAPDILGEENTKRKPSYSATISAPDNLKFLIATKPGSSVRASSISVASTDVETALIALAELLKPVVVVSTNATARLVMSKYNAQLKELMGDAGQLTKLSNDFEKRLMDVQRLSSGIEIAVTKL
ncbi:hypothetical protein [Serratia phage BUCT660]|nr:hypothetical protein [Serratia phage BUCT660]